MPFNAQGLLQRMHKWKKDHNNGIKIIASRMDQDTDSIVDGINQILQGQTKFLGQLKTIFGTKSKPSFSFSEETDTGMYRPEARQLGLSVGGNEKINVADSQTTVNGNMNVTGQLDLDWDNQTNKGHNSKIDADKLDGQHGEYYTDPNNLSRNIPASKLSGSYGISITGNAASATTADNSSRLGGQTPNFYQNAGNINTGELSPQRLSGTYNINVRGEVVGGRLGSSALYSSPQYEGKNGWFTYSYTRGETDAPFNLSGLFVFHNTFVNYNNGRQKGFFPSHGETNSAVPEFERLRVNGIWKPWRRIPKSSQDIAGLLPPQGTNTSQKIVTRELEYTRETNREIPEFATAITPRSVNSQIKIEVSLAYMAYIENSTNTADAVVSLYRNQLLDRYLLYKSNVAYQRSIASRHQERMTFSYIDTPRTTSKVTYRIKAEKYYNKFIINSRRTDSKVGESVVRDQHSSVILTDLGPKL